MGAWFTTKSDENYEPSLYKEKWSVHTPPLSMWVWGQKRSALKTSKVRLGLIQGHKSSPPLCPLSGKWFQGSEVPLLFYRIKCVCSLHPTFLPLLKYPCIRSPMGSLFQCQLLLSTCLSHSQNSWLLLSSVPPGSPSDVAPHLGSPLYSTSRSSKGACLILLHGVSSIVKPGNHHWLFWSTSMLNTLFLLLFWVRVPSSPGWPQTCYIVRDDLELIIPCLHLPSAQITDMHMPWPGWFMQGWGWNSGFCPW